MSEDLQGVGRNDAALLRWMVPGAGLAAGLPGVDLREINCFAGGARHHFYNLNGLN